MISRDVASLQALAPARPDGGSTRRKRAWLGGAGAPPFRPAGLSRRRFRTFASFSVRSSAPFFAVPHLIRSFAPLRPGVEIIRAVLPRSPMHALSAFSVSLVRQAKPDASRCLKGGNSDNCSFIGQPNGRRREQSRRRSPGRRRREPQRERTLLGLVTPMEAGQPARDGEAACRRERKRERIPAGLPGVRRGGTCRKRRWEPGRPAGARFRAATLGENP